MIRLPLTGKARLRKDLNRDMNESPFSGAERWPVNDHKWVRADVRLSKRKGL